MTMRRLWTFLVPLAIVTGGRLHAQDADNAAQPVEVQLIEDWTVTAASNPTELVWNFAAATHGNTLGVEVAPPDEPLRAQLGLEPQAGVVVTSILPDSAALTAGLKQHDIILKLGDEPVSSAERFHELVSGRRGQDVVVHVLRQGKPADVTVKLPDVPVWTVDFGVPAMLDSHYRIGVTIAEADDTLRSQLNLAAGEGLVVTDVIADGPAAKAGLKRHDVFIKLDNKRLTTVEKANALIQKIKDRPATVVFLRAGREHSLEITPRLSSDPSAVWFETRLGYLDGLHRGHALTLQPNTFYVGADGRTDYGRPLGTAWVPNSDGIFSNLLFGVHSPPDSKPAQPATTVEQITRLKQQLAELQSTVQALEAALQTAPAEKQPETPPRDKQRDASQDQ
jgi:membrane-associated protease RseP (regulator of RpoE activity)